MKELYSRFDREYFLEQCRRFSIPEDKVLKEFSTGMLAKLKILLALSYHPKILILDEPTSGLDVLTRDELLTALREYMEESEEREGFLSVLIVSSDLEGLCDDMYMIDQGKIVMYEETDVLLDEYGILKVSASEYRELDKSFLLKKKKESFGYSCLTKEKYYYMENYPSAVVEKCSLDEVISIMVKGEERMKGLLKKCIWRFYFATKPCLLRQLLFWQQLRLWEAEAASLLCHIWRFLFRW